MGKKLNVGILGLGVVGSGVVQVLAKQKEQIETATGVQLTITKALIRPQEDKQALAEEFGLTLTTEVTDITKGDEIDIVVEVIGKIHPAKEFIAEALTNGKHVVTANKDLLAQHGTELVTIAKENKVSLFYEASVAGGIPILRTITDTFVADEITEVLGIINGTTNYMLTQMEETGLSYDESLTQAQHLGFAESDPTNDVDGIDAAYKTVILTRFAYGTDITLADFQQEGIRGIDAKDIKLAKKLGYEVKLIGLTKKISSGVFAEVAPMLIPQQHPLASIRNEFNGVFVKSTGIGQSMYYGPGAGSLPTATSVVADLAAIAKQTQFDLPAQQFKEYATTKELAKAEDVFYTYFVALDVPDHQRTWNEYQEKMRAVCEFEIVTEEKGRTGRKRVVITTDSIDRPTKAALVEAIETNADCHVTRIMKIMGDE